MAIRRASERRPSPGIVRDDSLETLSDRYRSTAGIPMSPFGYKRLFGPPRRSVRSTPKSRPPSPNVRFTPDFVGFTPGS